MTTPKQMVDDQFWFDESKKMISSGSDSRNEAASILQKTLGWLWGVYTSVVFIGVGLSDTSYSVFTICLIVLPSPVIIVGYWLAVWAQIPLAISFETQSPDDIRNAYIRGTNLKAKRLQLALRVSAVATILVSLALVASSIDKNMGLENDEKKIGSDSHNSITSNQIGRIQKDIQLLSELVSSLHQQNLAIIDNVENSNDQITAEILNHSRELKNHLDRHLVILTGRIDELHQH